LPQVFDSVKANLSKLCESTKAKIRKLRKKLKYLKLLYEEKCKKLVKLNQADNRGVKNVACILNYQNYASSEGLNCFAGCFLNLSPQPRLGFKDRLLFENSKRKKATLVWLKVCSSALRLKRLIHCLHNEKLFF